MKKIFNLLHYSAPKGLNFFGNSTRMGELNYYIIIIAQYTEKCNYLGGESWAGNNDCEYL